MSRILDLYADLLQSKERFTEDIFEKDEYTKALPKLTIFDVGAFGGEFSFYCYNFADKIYAFEPDPSPYAALKKRVEKYGMDKIEIFPLAIAASTGERTFHASGQGGSRLLTDSEAQPPEKEKIKVKTITLIDFMEEHKIDHIDIFKIDIEGGEDEIIRSVDFKRVVDRIDVIIGEHLGSVDAILQAYGFTRTQDKANAIYKR
jgi:FkbM family methyltransferase